MTVSEIIEDLERHIARYGGEEVTENVSTRDLLAALKKPEEVPEEIAADSLAQLLWKWHDESGAPLEVRSYLRGLAAWLVAKGVRG